MRSDDSRQPVGRRAAGPSPEQSRRERKRGLKRLIDKAITSRSCSAVADLRARVTASTAPYFVRWVRRFLSRPWPPMRPLADQVRGFCEGLSGTVGPEDWQVPGGPGTPHLVEFPQAHRVASAAGQHGGGTSKAAQIGWQRVRCAADASEDSPLMVKELRNTRAKPSLDIIHKRTGAVTRRAAAQRSETRGRLSPSRPGSPFYNWPMDLQRVEEMASAARHGVLLVA